MLEDEDPIMILGSVARQIRLLLLARSVLDRGGSINEVIDELTHYSNLKISAYPARLAGEQARRMTSADLELLYRRLLEIDEAVKTGQMDPDLALDLFVTSFTTRQA
jgi:DNA polymerase-3 subunit delta